MAKSRTVLYTPGVLTTPRLLRNGLDQTVDRTNICIAKHLDNPQNIPLDRWGTRRIKNYVQLIIVDESERLSATGLEKQFSHYPQFYSRVGFAHHYRPLGNDELHTITNDVVEAAQSTLVIGVT